MYKKPGESYQTYRDRVLDSISPSFCGAKWYNASIWLNNGMTTSCHHPPAHKIPLEELKKSVKALHNTEYKKMVRQEMLLDRKPKECEYCWRIEALGPDKVSDRVYKSIIYTEDDLAKAAFDLGPFADVDLKTLEIAFDSNCNFSCSYCNPSFSTSWQGDVKTNGPYQNLVSDGAAAYQQDGSWTIPYGLKNEGNPYIEAFWRWWEGELQHSLTELRITGGEATMSPEFWKLLDWWKSHPECKVRLAVNSNLGAKASLIERLCEASHSFEHIELYTSNETVGSHAEYIRDGMDYKVWLSNLEMLFEKGNFKGIHIMMTINSLCLFQIDEFLNEVLKLKMKYKSKFPMLSFNILRFPSFMSIVTLPENIRTRLADKLEAWLKHNIGNMYLQDFERDGIVRTIAYIREIETGHSNTSSIESRERDFRSFFTQYDQRRGKDFFETFKEETDLVEWVKGIPETKLNYIQIFVDGDSSRMTEQLSAELKEKAAAEGWVLNPQGANPGSKDFNEGA